MASSNRAMRKVSLRNVAAHKLRLGLTLLAVFLGSAFIAGASMFTNSLSNSFDSAIQSAFSNVDAVVSDGATMDDRNAIAQNPDVRSVNVSGDQIVVVATNLGDDAKPLQTRGEPSKLFARYPADQAVGEAKPIVEGREPAGPDEVVINKAAAKNFKINVGDKILLVDPQTRHEETVTGLYSVKLDQGTSVGALMAEDAFVERYASDGRVGQLTVAAKPGVDAQSLRDSLAKDLPGRKVETGQALADQTSNNLRQSLSFINYFLVAFGLVGLLVGTFLIANTFSMIVAQRTREFALLRALGASRRQISRSVVFEAIVIGLLGSMLGVVAGVGLVAAIKAVMATRGASTPGSGLGLSTTAVVLPIVLGTVVTVISAWAPARKAGSVQPVEAMRSTEGASPQPLKVRNIIGSVLLLIAAILAAAALRLTGQPTRVRVSLVGGTAVTGIIGLAMVGPALSLFVVPLFGRVMGAPFKAVGKLASTNSSRNPHRTSTTAFALALGVALVTGIGMLGATMKATVSKQVEDHFSADFLLTGSGDGRFPVPHDVPGNVANLDGVGSVITSATTPVMVGGQYGYPSSPRQGVTQVIDGNPWNVVKLNVKQGTGDMDPHSVLVSESYAEDHGWTLGQKLPLTAPGITDQTREVTVAGIYLDNPVYRTMIVSKPAAEELVPDRMMNIGMVGVKSNGQVSKQDLRSELEGSLQKYLVVQVMDSKEMAGSVNTMIDQMLSIMYGMLALAVVIAILGIINTLTLNVIERRQEIGMLRAVGTQRTQVRTMITLEAVQISIFGVLLGIVSGIALGWTFLKVLSTEGLNSPTIPWGFIGWMMLGSLAVGLLAALWPARRAATTAPLEAIAD